MRYVPENELISRPKVIQLGADIVGGEREAEQSINSLTVRPAARLLVVIVKSESFS